MTCAREPSSTTRSIAVSAGDLPRARATSASVLPTSGWSARVWNAVSSMPSGPAPAKKFSQVALPSCMSWAQRARVAGSSRRCDPGVEPALAHPRRHRRVEARRRGVVGVHVGAEVDAARARRFDAPDGVGELAPALPAGLLEVVDLDGDVGAAADLDHLVDRLAEPGAFVAHVRRVEPALLRGDRGEGDELVGGEGFVGRVDERGGEPERAFVHRLRHHRAHALELDGRRVA